MKIAYGIGAATMSQLAESALSAGATAIRVDFPSNHLTGSAQPIDQTDLA